MSELDDQQAPEQVPDVEQQLGQPEEPQQEEDQSDVTEGDVDERISDLEDRVGNAEEVANLVAQSNIQEPLANVFPARFDTNGNLQELCVVNGSLSDMIGGRSNSGWTGISLGAGQGLVVEAEDYDPANSRSKMQFLLLGAGTASASLIPVSVTQDNGAGHAGDSANQCTFTYTIINSSGGTLSTGVTPAMQRPSVGKQVAAQIGIWVVGSNQLWWCDEVDAVTVRVCP